MRELRSGSTRPARAAFDRLAPAYDRRWARYTAATIRETLARLSLQPGERLLDLGCGTGALLQALAVRGAPSRLSGVDLSPAMVALARARLPVAVRLAVADGAALPFPAGSFDVVVSSSSFHFWPRPDRVLGELGRVLAAGGRLAITDWCGDFLACRLYDRVLRLLDPAHQEVLTLAACGELLRMSGLVDVCVERYRAAWPWGMMTATAHTSARSCGSRPEAAATRGQPSTPA
ncbi:MAG TPA: methyltransferase domain-containing protein [Thermoanaerobaculia bacterium]